MSQNSYQISKLEMMIMLVSMIIGVGILTLPRTLATAVGTPDGWISLIIGAVINMLLVFLIVRLHRNFPNMTLLRFINNSKAKVLGKILGILFVIYFIMLLGYEARSLSLVIRMYVLDRTPSEIVVLLMFLMTTYAVSKGVQAIVHLNLLFIPFLFAVLFILTFFNIPNANFDALRPVAAEGFMPIFIGLKETIVSFLGIEILFFFLAYMKLNDMKAASINVGIAIVTSIYIVITIMSYMILSFEASEVIVYPLVTLAKEVQIIEGVIERYDPLMITIWIMTIFNTMSIAHFLTAKIIKDEFLKKIRFSSIAIWITFFAYTSTFIPISIQETAVMGQYTSYLGFGLIFISIVVGYIFVWIKKVSKKQAQSEVV